MFEESNNPLPFPGRNMNYMHICNTEAISQKCMQSNETYKSGLSVSTPSRLRIPSSHPIDPVIECNISGYSTSIPWRVATHKQKVVI